MKVYGTIDKYNDRIVVKEYRKKKVWTTLTNILHQ